MRARVCNKQKRKEFIYAAKAQYKFFLSFVLMCVFSPPTCLKKNKKKKFWTTKKEKKNRHFFFPESCPPHPFSYLQTKLFFLEREREKRRPHLRQRGCFFLSVSVSLFVTA